MEYNEEDLIKKLKDWQPKVNAEEIWNSVKNKAPVKRRKRNKFLIPFLLGLCTGILGMYWVSIEQNAALVCDKSAKEDLLNKQLASVQKQLYAVINELEQFRMADGQNKEAPDNELRPDSSMAVASEPSTKGNIEIAEADKMSFEAQTIIENELKVDKEDNDWQENSNERVNQGDGGWDASSAMTGSLVVPFKYHLHSLEKLTMPEMKVNANRIAKLRNEYFEAGYGLAYNLGDPAINVANEFEGIRRTANVQYLSWSKSSAMNEHFAADLSVQVLRTNTGFDYNYRHREMIGVIDTARMLIDPTGNVIPVIGSHTAIKITEKTGVFYLTDYRLGVVPGVSLKYNLTKRLKMVHSLGLGFDFFQIKESPPQFLTAEGLWGQRKTGFMLSPILKMGHRIEHALSAHNRAYFILSLTLIREKLTLREKENKYNFILPTIGIGLTI